MLFFYDIKLLINYKKKMYKYTFKKIMDLTIEENHNKFNVIYIIFKKKLTKYIKNILLIKNYN